MSATENQTVKLEIYRQIYSSEKNRFVRELKEFLKIQSISTDSAFKAECRHCANWLVDHLTHLGLTASIVETDGQPAVMAEKKVGESLPTLLFYGHYDVQPVDPLNLWTNHPFEPVEKDGKIWARGAQDNKGQLFYFIKGLEAVLSKGDLSYNIKILIEGEEECGSGAITKKLPDLRGKLKSDVLLVCDTGTPDKRLGCITMGLRGILHLEVRIYGPHKDLHSGVHGGLVKNPAVELAKIIAQIHDENGRITIPGFYDGVLPISAEDKALANAFLFTDEWYKGEVGMLPTGGEKGVPPMERRGLRPTVEVNGFYSGYLGEGSKTIIPSSATVKISSRVVAKQDPEQTLEKIISFLREKTPKEFRFEVIHAGAAGEALLVSASSAEVRRAAPILKELTGSDPLYLWEGASIPFIPALMEASGATPLLVGFGLEEDNIHAPNESFSLEQFEKGFLFVCGLLSSSH